YLVSIELRPAGKGTFDLCLHVGSADMRLDDNAVGDATHAHDVFDGMFGGTLLILPLDFTFKRHPAVLNGNLNSTGWNGDIETQAIQDRLGDVGIASRHRAGQLDAQLLCDRL